MPLYTLVVVDKHGHGQPVLARKDEGHIHLFLADVVQWETKTNSATFITDKQTRTCGG